MLRLLHTSDWHLGHTLHDLPREREHVAFLTWLRETLHKREVDALVIAGDVFDAAHPPPTAQRMWYEFLAGVWRDMPQLEVVVIGGNHDSASRLDAPNPMFRALGRLHVVGSLQRRPDGAIDEHSLLIPLHNRAGATKAWVAAVPFLRSSDLPPAMDLLSGVRAVYQEVLDAIRRRRQPDQALIATGHAYFVGGQISDRSERKIQSGNQLALPVELFPPDVTYAALGHLHLAQNVSGLEHVRYSGSPLPFSMTEADYPHQVCLVELEGAQLRAVTPLLIPRSVDLRRIPARDAAPLPTILSEIQRLPLCTPSDDEGLYPYLELAVLVAQPEPHLRQALLTALEGRQARLVRFTQVLGDRSSAPPDVLPQLQGLEDLLPRDIFEACWKRSSTLPVSKELWRAFDQLQEWAEHPDDARRQRERRASP